MTSTKQKRVKTRKLANGLNVHVYCLADPQVRKVAEACEKPTLPPGLTAKIERELYKRYVAVEVNLGEKLWLIYYNTEDVFTLLRKPFPEPFNAVFMIVYEAKAYLYLHDACPLLLKAITHKIPPKIMALLEPSNIKTTQRCTLNPDQKEELKWCVQ